MRIRTGALPLLVMTVVLALGACGDSPAPAGSPGGAPGGVDDTSGSVAPDAHSGAGSQAAGRGTTEPSSTPDPARSDDDPDQAYLVCVAEVGALAELLTRLQIGTTQDGVRWNGLLSESRRTSEAGDPEEATQLCEQVRDEMTEAAQSSADSEDGD